MTYDELIDSILYVTTKTNDPTFELQIPSIIHDAQYDAQARLNVLGAQTTAEGFIQPLTNTLVKPYNWFRTVSFEFVDPNNNDKVYFLMRRSYGYVRSVQDSNLTEGIPIMYANTKEFSEILFTPKPPALPLPYTGYPYTFRYHTLINPLNETIQQNWLTNLYPQLLENACLYWAFHKLRNMDLASYYKKNFLEDVQVALQTEFLQKKDQTIDYAVS